MKQVLIALFAVATSTAVSISCKDNEACERSRLEVAKDWERVKAGAARRKLAPPEEEGTRPQIEQWTQIENEADTIVTSFQTTQVTWTAAEKSRAAIQQKLMEVASATDMGYKMFERTFKEAAQKTDKFREQCR